MKSIIPIVCCIFIVGFIGCHDCPEDLGLDYLRLDSIELSASFKDNTWTSVFDSVVFDADTLHVQLNIESNVIANESDHFQLVNAAYAAKCKDVNYGMYGMRDRVTSLRITSDQPFLGIAAGDTIHQFIRHYPPYGSDSFQTINASIELINNGTDCSYRIVQKPSEPIYRRFIFNLEVESGRTVVAQTAVMKWQ